MSDDKSARGERSTDAVACVRCLEVRDLMELDRLLWCDRCRRKARERAGWWGWVGGVLFGAGVAAYVWIVVQPTDLVIGGWFGTVAAAIWIGSKVCRELVYGSMRFLNSRGVEAEAPTSRSDG